MQKVSRLAHIDYFLLLPITFLVLTSIVVLRSLAPEIFPLYFLFIIVGYLSYFLFIQIDFDVISVFSKHLYVFSIILLLLPLLIGQVTRGAIRWIPLGPITLQPSEIVRPFLLLFFAIFFTQKRVDIKRLIQGLILIILPVFLILIQPSLGVAALTIVGFVGVLLASTLPKKYILAGIGMFIVLIPIIWTILAPYQQQRIVYFLNPGSDPLGAGYNSIQSMITVGSGKLLGRGLGEGVQTQLAFLPEKNTDFIFAATAEELGFLGVILLLVGIFMILWRLIKIIDIARSPSARAMVAGIFTALFAETIIHVGMNMGLLPITGVPLPLVSAGGSAFLATMISLALATTAIKPSQT